MPQSDGITPGAGDIVSGLQGVDAFLLVFNPQTSQWDRLRGSSAAGVVVSLTTLPAGSNTLGTVTATQGTAAASGPWLVTQYGFADSVTLSGGKVTAPVTSTAVAIVTPSNGTYQIYVTAGLLSGSPGALDAANMQLQNGTVTISTLAIPSGVTAQPYGPFRVTVTGTTGISVNAIASSTGGVVYGATMAVTRIA